MVYVASPTAKKQQKRHESPEPRIPRAYRAPASILIAALCIAILVYLTGYSPYIGVYLKILLVIVVLALTGVSIAYVLKAAGLYGFFILKTDNGINYIDHLSRKYEKPWKAIVDWGFVLSFGLLTPFIFKNYTSKKMFAFGIISIILMQILVLPYLSVAYGLINIPQLSSGASAYAPPPTSSGIDWLGVLFTALSVIGGFALFIISELAFIAGVIIHGIALFALASATSPTSAAASVSALPGPAGVPVIAVAFFRPSIIIPLVLALALLVTLHEFSHGIIARQNKIKIKSIGTFLFGIIPLGAFVEPVEKDISKLPVKSQDKISIAGISMNFFLTIVFFLLMLLMLYVVLPPLFTNAVYIEGIVPGSPSQNVLAPGAIVNSWNGHAIKNITDLESAAASDLPHSIVTVSTSNGTYSLTANATGKIGVYLGEESVPASNSIVSALANFFYEFFGLSFLLNFYVAIFNVLPIPLFDGWRIYKLKLGARGMKIVTIVALAILILLFVPWIWSV